MTWWNTICYVARLGLECRMGYEKTQHGGQYDLEVWDGPDLVTKTKGYHQEQTLKGLIDILKGKGYIEVATEPRDESRGSVIKRPSFGQIAVSRSSGGQRLFACSVENHSVVRIRITGASIRRDLNRDWIHGDASPIVEVHMSPAQWAEFVSSFNTSGVPCTLAYTKEDGMIEHIPEENKREVFTGEFESNIKKATAKAAHLEAKAQEILKRPGPVKATEKAELLSAMFEMTRIVRDSIPFMANQWNEQMDKSVIEAKKELEAYTTMFVEKLGMEAIKSGTATLALPGDSLPKDQPNP